MVLYTCFIWTICQLFLILSAAVALSALCCIRIWVEQYNVRLNLNLVYNGHKQVWGQTMLVPRILVPAGA